jgi:hypothetical protein
MRSRFVFLAAALAAAQVTLLSKESRAGEAAPEARTGFQMALRTGYQVPVGNAASGASMGDAFSGQVPLALDLGWKPIPNLFVGAYGSLGFGGTAGQTARECDQIQASCLTISFRIGLEAQYHFIPEGKVNPWVGYGIGLESSGFSVDKNGETKSLILAGWEYGHFMGGVDFRLSKTIGIGPFVDFSLGQYSHQSSQTPGSPQVDGDISNQALHEWILIGGRVVFFP